MAFTRNDGNLVLPLVDGRPSHNREVMGVTTMCLDRRGKTLRSVRLDDVYRAGRPLNWAQQIYDLEVAE